MVAEKRRAPTKPPLTLPDELEANCFVLAKRDGLTQCEIGERLHMNQSTVARKLRQFDQKWKALIESGKFDEQQLELLIFKLIGNAPRNARMM